MSLLRYAATYAVIQFHYAAAVCCYALPYADIIAIPMPLFATLRRRCLPHAMLPVIDISLDVMPCRYLRHDTACYIFAMFFAYASCLRCCAYAIRYWFLIL